MIQPKEQTLSMSQPSLGSTRANSRFSADPHGSFRLDWKCAVDVNLLMDPLTVLRFPEQRGFE